MILYFVGGPQVWLAETRVLWDFALVFLLPVLLRLGRRSSNPVIRSPRVLSLPSDIGEQGRRILPLLTWALIAALRVNAFWLDRSQGLASPPRETLMQEFLWIAQGNIFALCLLCVVQVTLLTFRGELAATLGLSGTYRWIGTLVVSGILLETACLMAWSVILLG